MATSSDDTAPHLVAPGGDGALRVLLSTAPPGKARDLAAALVEEGLAACVNLVPGVRSLFRWKGALQDDPETLMVIKTAAARLEALAARLGELHPYEVPELLVLAPEAGLPAYLAWAAKETAPPTPEA
jgi:periplasmic divalent cation tolerance protein